MSAFVKLSITSRQANYLRVELLPEVTMKPTASTMGVELVGTPTIYILGGEKHGLVLDGTTVKANQKVCIHFGQVSPYKFHAQTVAHPGLAEYGTAQVAGIMEPGDTADIAIYFRAERQVDLTEFPWLVRMYLMD